MPCINVLISKSLGFTDSVNTVSAFKWLFFYAVANYEVLRTVNYKFAESFIETKVTESRNLFATAFNKKRLIVFLLFFKYISSFIYK